MQKCIILLTEAGLAKEPGDLQNIDAMLQVSVAENAKLYEKVRRNKAMCEALRTLMKDEIDKEIKEATEKEHKANIEKLAESYIETGAAKTKKEALKLAKAILG